MARTASVSLALAAALAASLAALPARAEDWSAWTHHQDLYLNTGPDGANVAGPVTRFPLLIRLDASNFDFTKARSDGKDIRFSKSKAGEALLPFKVERWDAAKSKAEIWVRMDTVRGNDAEQSLRMHFGNAAAGDAPGIAPVFDSSDGFLDVFHMGGTGNRPNEVGGFLPGAAQNYDGNESKEGLIGLCDSLGIESGSEDHLMVNDPLDQFSKGFTFSTWAYPVDMGKDAALLSIGNGAGLDNIHIKRASTTTSLILDVYNSNQKSAPVTVANVLLSNQWQHIAVTIDGLSAKVYRNGVLAGSGTLTQTASPNRKAFNYIGKSSWYGDAPFAGRLDEVVLARKAMGADWIKLSHANQKAGQDLVVFQKPTPTCVMAFAAPRDTTLAEGSLLELAGKADCATSYEWTPVAGPVPRLLDPSVKVLPLSLPRVTRDTSLTLRFSGTFSDSVRSGEVKVTIKEASPDPVFTFPAAMGWNGKDSLMVKPQVTNMEAVKASRDSVLNFAWKVDGMEVDTGWRAEGLMLIKTSGTGEFTLSLCLDNGGAASCKDLPVKVGDATAVLGPLRKVGPAGSRIHRDVRGRLLGGEAEPPVRAYPAQSGLPR